MVRELFSPSILPNKTVGPRYMNKIILLVMLAALSACNQVDTGYVKYLNMGEVAIQAMDSALRIRNGSSPYSLNDWNDAVASLPYPDPNYNWSAKITMTPEQVLEYLGPPDFIYSVHGGASYCYELTNDDDLTHVGFVIIKNSKVFWFGHSCGTE